MSYTITGRTTGYTGLGATTSSSSQGTVLMVGLGALLLYVLYVEGSHMLRSKPVAETRTLSPRKRTCYRKSPRLTHAEHDVLREHFGFDVSILYKLSDAEVKDGMRAVARRRTAAAKGAASKLRKELADRAWEEQCQHKTGATS